MKTLHLFHSALFLIPLSLSLTGNSQNVAINTTGVTADPSALLDMKSTTAGVLIPRMTTAQRNAISSPAIGLQVFNTDCEELNYWNGTCWLSLGAPLPIPDSISSNSSTVLCAGATATYSIPKINGATSYHWTLPPGATINSGQGTTSISVTLGSYSGNVCVVAYDQCESSPAASCLAIQVNASPVSVSINATPSGTVSPGTTVTFTATPVNGGPTPSYQWMNGNTPVGTNSPAYTSAFTNGNVITCIMTTSNTACVTGSPATSNAITMSVTSPVTLNISTSTYNGRQVFMYAGGNQTFTVPSYVTQIFLKMWGAGGGGGYSGSGGSGAFVSGYQTVTPGSTLTVVVGGGGIYTSIINTSSPGGFGGGGASGSGSSSNPGSGGGRSAIQVTAGKDTATAGGGGGGGPSYNYNASGGGGGATTGGNGFYCASSFSSGFGNGGTTTTGGAASSNGNPSSLAASSIRYTYAGSAGGSNTYGGGGGGGGFFGGSGGDGNTSENAYLGGGGGGSSYLGSLTSSVNGAGKGGTNNSSQVAVVNPTDVDYITGVGMGGAGGSNGGNGEVVIYW